jgi:hypothetical protein
MNSSLHSGKVDYIYFIISYSKEIEYSELLDEYGHEINVRGIDEMVLQSILETLVSDGYVGKSKNCYFLTAKGEKFYGYNYEENKSNKKEKRNGVLDKSIKIGELVGVLIFGCSTWYYNHANKVNEEKIKTQNSIIFNLQEKNKEERLAVKSLSIQLIELKNTRNSGNKRSSSSKR